MTQTFEFKGRTLAAYGCELGEGPTYEEAGNTLWWFSILEKKLFELDLSNGNTAVHDLPFMASVIAPVDLKRQMLATDQGVFLRDRQDGSLTFHCEIEPENRGNRSNDGRVHPSGALWIGTMGRSAERGAGAIYHVARGKVTKLFDRISIPNAICFSADGSVGYYVDSAVNHLMRVALDAATGLPTGAPTLLVDGSAEGGGMDGAVCDSDGNIWNARWGKGAVDCYAPDGTWLSRHLLPATQTSCPVFIGDGRMAVTSAWEGMDDAAKAADPEAGNLFEIAVDARGVETACYRP